MLRPTSRSGVVTLLVSGIGIAGLLGSVPGNAADPGAPATVSIRAGLVVTDFNYQEFNDSGRLLDREDGVLPGAVLGVSTRQGRGQVTARLLYHRGRADHEEPAFTLRTDEAIIDTSLHLGGWISIAGVERLMPYGGFGYRRWQRDILGSGNVSDLSETYSWAYVLAGLEAIALHGRWFDWRVDARLTYPLEPEIDVDFKGVFDSVRLDLGARLGWRLALPLSVKINDKQGLEVEPYYERINIGKGSAETLTKDGFPRGQVFEPKSKTENFGLMVSWIYHF